MVKTARSHKRQKLLHSDEMLVKIKQKILANAKVVMESFTAGAAAVVIDMSSPNGVTPNTITSHTS